jgi:cytochrome P450
MLGFTSILLVILLLLLTLFVYKCSKQRPKNFPPGPPKLPLWGSYWFLLKENYNLSHLAMAALGKKYKTDILGLFLGNFPAVVTLNIELSKELLTREEFIGRVDTILVRTRSFGDLKGIFFADGPVWKEHRRFSLRHMRDFGFGRRSDVMENFISEEITYLIDFLKNEPKEKDLNVCKSKGHVLVPDVFYGSLINTILSVLTSTRFDHHEVRQYAKAALKFMKCEDATGGAICMTPWLRFLAPDYFGYTSAVRDNRFIQKFLTEIIEDHLKTFSDDHHRDFVDVFISETLRQGVDLDQTQLLMVVLDYMFPSPIGLGHTLSFYFAYIINNPDVQVKVHEEIDRVVGQSRLPHLDDRKNMPYVEASLRECLRILPVTPLGLPRRCVQDTTLGGYFIPENTIMWANIWSAHRDQTIWKDPEEFRPERFLDEDGNLLKKDHTIGFGAGKRLCAGETFARQTMFLILSGLLQNFTFKSPNGKPICMDVIPGVTLSLKETWILAEPR